MKISLADFKQIIDPTILQRGQRYYDDGHVTGLEETDPGRWLATVSGTEPYQVIVAVTSGGNLDWTCDCPYDWGPMCKHVAATLYAIESATIAPSPKQAKPRKKRKSRADKLRAAIETLSKEELQALLLERSLDDRDLAHLILTRYGTDKAEVKVYARLVKDALHLGKGRQGYVDYWGAARTASAISELLKRADTNLEQGQPLPAISIYQAVIEGVVPAMAHVDDSMGALGDCIHFALDGLQRAAKQLAPPEKTTLFDYCVAKAPQKPYVEWDWGWDMVAIGAELVTSPQQRKTLFATLDKMAARRGRGGWVGDFDHERAALIKLAVVQRQDDDATVQAFLESHIQYERLRMSLARFHLQHGDIATARQVCVQWLEQPQPDKPGLRPDFLAILLDVATAAGDVNEQVRLAEALFQQTGHFEYYERLKELIGTSAWPAYRSGFLERLQQNSRNRVDFGALYIAEEMWPALLTYVQTNPYAASHYHQYLATRFPQELSGVYEHLALLTLREQVNRKGYRQVCGYLRRMQQLGEEDHVDELVIQFREQYKQRRALLDELNKAFGS